MLKKLFALISAFAFITFPLFAYADISVVNNSDSYATASIGSSPCSSERGSDGIAQPHGSLTIPGFVFNVFCGISTSCTGHVYMTNNCESSGPEVATVTVDALKGKITALENHDKERYDFSTDGKNVVINQVARSPKNGWHFLF